MGFTCDARVVVMEVEGHRYMALIFILEDDYEYKVMSCEQKYILTLVRSEIFTRLASTNDKKKNSK